MTTPGGGGIGGGGQGAINLATLWIPVVPETSAIGPAMEQAGRHASDRFKDVVRRMGSDVADSFRQTARDATTEFTRELESRTGDLSSVGTRIGEELGTRLGEAAGGLIRDNLPSVVTESIDSIRSRVQSGGASIGEALGTEIGQRAGELLRDLPGVNAVVEKVQEVSAAAGPARDAIASMGDAMAGARAGDFAGALANVHEGLRNAEPLARVFGIDISNWDGPLAEAADRVSDIHSRVMDAKSQAQDFANIFVGLPGVIGRVGGAIAELAGPLAAGVALGKQLSDTIMNIPGVHDYFYDPSGKARNPLERRIEEDLPWVRGLTGAGPDRQQEEDRAKSYAPTPGAVPLTPQNLLPGGTPPAQHPKDLPGLLMPGGAPSPGSGPTPVTSHNLPGILGLPGAPGAPAPAPAPRPAAPAPAGTAPSAFTGGGANLYQDSAGNWHSHDPWWEGNIQAESGGNIAPTSNPTHFGLFQFSQSTWDSIARQVNPAWVGRNPGTAPADVQAQIAQANYNQNRGNLYGQWANPYVAAHPGGTSGSISSSNTNVSSGALPSGALPFSAIPSGADPASAVMAGGGINLSTIPIAAQKYANDCIDASARIILSHSGVNMTEEQLEQVIAPGGSIESQAAGLNRLNPAGGYRAIAGSGGSPQALFNAVKASIDTGTGSILNVAPGSSIAGKPFSEGHFIAATGYNADGTINLSDTAGGTQYSVSAADAFQATRGRGIVAGTGSGPAAIAGPAAPGMGGMPAMTGMPGMGTAAGGGGVVPVFVTNWGGGAGGAMAGAGGGGAPSVASGIFGGGAAAGGGPQPPDVVGGLMQMFGLDGSVFKTFSGSSNPLQFTGVKTLSSLMSQTGGGGAGGGGGGGGMLSSLFNMIPGMPVSAGAVPHPGGGAPPGPAVVNNTFNGDVHPFNVTQNGVASPTSDLQGMNNSSGRSFAMAQNLPTAGG